MKKRLICAFCGAILLLGLLAGCGSSSIKKNLPGTWNNGFHTLTFYGDGTHEEQLKYGTGTWVILDGDILKLTDFYGETKTYTITEITNNTMTVNKDWAWEKVR